MLKEISYDALFDAQRHFRVLLDAMARPGTICSLNDVRLSPPGFYVATALIGFALMDTNVKFYIDWKDARADSYFTVNTAAQAAQAEQADFLFVKGNKYSDVVAKAKVGEYAYPENGATVIIEVEQLSAEPEAAAHCITLKGPGVNSQAKVYVQGLQLDFLKDIKEKNVEFPVGVDAIFTDKENHIFCIPRTANVQW